MNTPTKRAERIQSPSVPIPFRDPGGTVRLFEVWREDVLEWRPDERRPSEWYLVLDFGMEQRLARLPDMTAVYEPTGRVQLSLQPLNIPSISDWDPDTSEGLGPPINRFADAVVDIGDTPGGIPQAGRPMIGWVPHPVSRRRP